MNVEPHVGAIEPLLPEWEELFAADSEATPFMSPGWARSWLRHWGGGAQPWILAVRDGGQLIGLAPFVVRRRGPFRLLRELGSSPSRDVLARPGAREAVASAVADEIASRAAEWDDLTINRYPGGYALEHALSGRELRVRRRPPVPYPCIDLPASFDDYLAALSSKRRKDLRRHLRRLDDGTLVVREVREPGELATAVERWCDMQVRWWNQRRWSPAREARTRAYAEFVRDLMLSLVPTGSALVWELSRSDRVVGIEISLLDRATFYTWLGGYDTQVADLGPGKVAIAHGIRTATEMGLSRYDMMRGGQDYKYRYGAEDRYGQWSTFGSGRLASRVLMTGTAAARRLRRR